MKRVTRLLLAVLAALALTASVGAGSAGALMFESDAEPFVVEAEPEFEHSLTLGAGTSPYHCKGLGLIGESSTAITTSLSLNFGETVTCTSTNATATLESKGCNLAFDPDGGKYEGAFGFGPEGCGPMNWVATTSCDGTIPPQIGIGSEYEGATEGSREIVIAKPWGSLAWNGQGTVGACGSKTTGAWSGTWKFRAYDIAGNAKNLRIVSGGGGVYMSGKESESKAEQPRFDAEAFPVSLFGKASASHVFYRQGRVVECDNVTFDQPGSLLSSATQLVINSTYLECDLPIWKSPATVEMNGCQYSLSVLNVGPPYAGQTGISCPAKQSIVIKAYFSQQKLEEGLPGCVWSIGPQSGINGVSYGTVGTGTGRGINVDQKTKVTSVRVSGTALNCGGLEDKATEYTGSVSLFDQD